MTDTPDWVKYAKPGDKVVCITGHISEPSMPLVRGDIYTISGFLGSPIGLGIIIVECDFYHETNGIEYSGHTFQPRHFRPLQSCSTESGMAIFKSILTGQKVDSGVEA